MRISVGEATAGAVAAASTLDAAGIAGTEYHSTAIGPGGIEAIPDEHRHGSPWQLLFIWSAPNFEFATVFLGMIAVAYFELNFGQAVIAIVIGNVLGGIAHRPRTPADMGPARRALAACAGACRVRSARQRCLRGNVVPSLLQTAMAELDGPLGRKVVTPAGMDSMDAKD